MFAHCSPSSDWVPGGNTGEIKAANRHSTTYEGIRDYHCFDSNNYWYTVGKIAVKNLLTWTNYIIQIFLSIYILKASIHPVNMELYDKELCADVHDLTFGAWRRFFNLR